MKKFLGSNTKTAKLVRTIIQGILAVLIQYLADILGVFNFSAETVAIVTPLLMAVLSPIMAALGENKEEKE